MFFEEKFNEKKEDPSKDIITFKYPWTIDIPSSDENGVIDFSTKFKTNYKFHTSTWDLHFERNHINIFNASSNFEEPIEVWNGIGFCSYKLYYDKNKRLLLYSSPRIEMWDIHDAFITPDGFITRFLKKLKTKGTHQNFKMKTSFMSKFNDAFGGKTVKRIVILIELQLPAKYFYRPFELPTSYLSKRLCDEYPKDMDNDFRFEFLTASDFVFKCPDGKMPAMRIVLNNASEFMYKHFETSDDPELIVEHSLDVVKPIITYLHTLCFEMPQFFDLDYVRRLLEAINFFEPIEQLGDLKLCLQQALCRNFVEEKHTFNSILEWTSIACQNRFFQLESMVVTVIVGKFYYEWSQLFPPHIRNDDANPIFRVVFDVHEDRALWVFTEIDEIMTNLFLTNVILD